MKTTDEQGKTISILLKNRLVADNKHLAKIIYDNSYVQIFNENDVVIKQGKQNEDHVYFIISGEVDVFRDNNLLETRSAPDTVGEMAAKNPHNSRNAKVVVKSELLYTRVVSGENFRKLIENYIDFQYNYTKLIEEVAERRILESGNEITESTEEKNKATESKSKWFKDLKILIPFGILFVGLLSLILQIIVDFLPI